MKRLPPVSIVIPAYNEAVMLPSCLESLKEQDYKGKYEIILVDNNSTDLTPKIGKIYGAKVKFEKKQGVAFARQAGFSKATGEIILSTDADTIVPTNWISKIVEVFQRDAAVVAVGGGCDLIGANTPLKLISKSITPFMLLLDKFIDYPGTLQGWNFGVRKKSFQKAGGFNLSLSPDQIGEDRDLGKRLRKIGKVKILHQIKVKTSARRFVGLLKTFRYVFINYFYFFIKKKSLDGSFQTIRQKPFESYDSITNIPLSLSFIIICLAVIALLVGAIPSTNLWSTSSVRTNEKVIALTFDSGPTLPYTKEILNVLGKREVRATFFVTAKNAKQNPSLIKQIYDNGNIIGNQSSSLSVSTMFKIPSAVVRDANSTNIAIDKIIGKRPRFYRPPSGYRTIWGSSALDKSGYEIVTWNDTPAESFGKQSSKKIAIDIIKNAKPGGIIALHDGHDATPNNDSLEQTVKATEEIIDLLQADGYKFVTLDELLQKPAYF